MIFSNKGSLSLGAWVSADIGIINGILCFLMVDKKDFLDD
jgi:hypothetical protein